jgi:hypothetical protein
VLGSMRKIQWALVLTLVAQGATAQQEEFSWLVGTWQEVDKSNFEVWTLVGQELLAESYELQVDGTKKISEKIRLIKKMNAFFYVPDVPHNKKPVEFKITSFNTTGFVAENPQHDFPKKITYQLDGIKMTATISDDSKTYSYFFQKVK